MSSKLVEHSGNALDFTVADKTRAESTKGATSVPEHKYMFSLQRGALFSPILSHMFSDHFQWHNRHNPSAMGFASQTVIFVEELWQFQLQTARSATEVHSETRFQKLSNALHPMHSEE